MVDVAVDEPLEMAHAPVRRVVVGAVDLHPEVFPVPDVDEGVVEPRVLPIVQEIRVVVDLHHAAVVQDRHLVVPDPAGRRASSPLGP